MNKFIETEVYETYYDIEAEESKSRYRRVIFDASSIFHIEDWTDYVTVNCVINGCYQSYNLTAPYEVVKKAMLETNQQEE